jgi:hypothetical protein
MGSEHRYPQSLVKAFGAVSRRVPPRGFPSRSGQGGCQTYGQSFGCGFGKSRRAQVIVRLHGHW